PGQLEEPVVAPGAEKTLIASFEENRKSGRGHFMTREDIAKVGTRRLADVLSRVPGAAVVHGRSNAGYPGTTRPPSKPGSPLGRGPDCDAGGHCTTPRNDAAAGIYCPDDIESRSGIECGCYAQVYVNNMLMNRGNPAPPFDVNTVPTEQVEALEYYRSAAETPPRYSGSAAQCGVLVLWTKRS
ncbi:MAG TPA: hypothetical protein VF483_07325, partial [Gemmatimonadaceae bacterium]